MTVRTPREGARVVKPKIAGFFVAVLLLIGITVIMLPRSVFLPGGASGYPLCADAKDLTVSATATVSVKSHCLSGWLSLPPNVNFAVDSPGEVEYFFWNGRRVMAEKNATWLGEVPSSTFRLRGKDGVATIHLEKKRHP